MDGTVQEIRIATDKIVKKIKLYVKFSLYNVLEFLTRSYQCLYTVHIFF